MLNNLLYELNPKILSFEEKFIGINKASGQHFLLPCLAYKVSLAIKKERDLNALEQVVLELINCGITDKLELSELCGFNYSDDKNTELVTFISNKLQQAGFIDNRNYILASGKAIVEQWQEDNSAIKMVAVTIYYDLLNNKFLPVLNKDKHQYKTVEKNRNGVVKFSLGSIGSNRGIGAKMIAYEQIKKKEIALNNTQPVPSSNQVIGLIKLFIKRQNLTNSLSSSFENKEVYLPKTNTITIEKSPEALFIHIQAIKQVGNNDVISSDGFGLGFSSVNKKLLEKYEEKELIKLKIDAQLVRNNESSSKNYIQLDSSLNQFPAIKNQILAIERNYKGCLIAVKTSNEEKEKSDKLAQLFLALYSAIEHALAVTCRQYPTDWKQHYINHSANENGNVVLSYANQLGFQVNKSTENIFNVPKGKLTYSNLDKPNLPSVIALNMAAAIEYKKHPMHSVVKKLPDLFNKIPSLKVKRNVISHGDNDSKLIKMVSSDDVKEYKIWVYQMLNILLPSIKLPEHHSATKQENADSDEVEQRSLQISINLDDVFGMAILSLIPFSLKEELERAEKQLICSKNSDDYDYSLFINNLSSSLQKTIFQVKQNFIGGNIENISLDQEAYNKAKKADFALYDNKLPEEISSVNKGKIIDACHHIESTLGAEIYAFLIDAEESDLKNIQSAIPNFLMDVNELLSFRKHGNSKITADYSAMEKLKQSVFHSIKVIMETYSE